MEFLLEINTEELPPSHLEPALSLLQTKIEEELARHDVVCSSLETLGTCRRLVVFGDFESQQPDKNEQITGPPKSVALASDGSFTQAAKGFANAHGISLKNLEILSRKKGEYVGFWKTVKGRKTREILTEKLPRIISSMTFPKMMRWGQNPLRFSRPIQNILCLFDNKVLGFSVGGIQSRYWTTGHRMHFPKKIKVACIADYKKELKKHKVILDREERKRRILSQAEKKLAPFEAEILEDEELFNKLVNDVEFPYVILGTFPGKFLKLPIEVLSTAMKAGQNLFAVVKGRKQLACFLGVADAYRDPKRLIQKGNERVLKARLEDATFFWEQDKRTHLKERIPSLKNVTFQEKLGSYYDKSQRVRKIAVYLANKLEEQKKGKLVSTAADLCKVDLVMEMVKEFPSLQGKMGGLYSREEGYPTAVWKAVYEHYQPVGLEDDVPSSMTGAILSIADKIDSIIGTLGIGIEVSGSKDPFGLRRNALGVCKVILTKKMSFSSSLLLDKVIKVYGEMLDRHTTDVKNNCLEFFLGRLEHIYESQGHRYDLVKAALGPGIDNIYHTSLKLKALNEIKKSPQFEPLILIAKRVNNILRDQPNFRINSGLFQKKEERDLYTTFSIIKNNILPMIAKGEFSRAQRIVLKIKSSINDFFDEVLVMAEDPKLRRNRLALLQDISGLLNTIADYSAIVIEG